MNRRASCLGAQVLWGTFCGCTAVWLQVESRPVCSCWGGALGFSTEHQARWLGWVQPADVLLGHADLITSSHIIHLPKLCLCMLPCSPDPVHSPVLSSLWA